MAAGILHDGSATVSSAGTPVPLSTTSVKCNWISIQPLAANTGAVYLGASTVTSTRGISLLVGDFGIAYPMLAFAGYDLSTIYIDGATNGNGVQFIYTVI